TPRIRRWYGNPTAGCSASTCSGNGGGGGGVTPSGNGGCGGRGGSCGVSVIRLCSAQPFCEVGVELSAGDAHLLHRVTLAHGHGVIFKRVKVDGDTERGTDLVLTTVSTADRARVVEVNVPVFTQILRHFTGNR